MGRMLPVRLVGGRLCSAWLDMYSVERQWLWLDAPFVNDLGHYWYRSIAQILSLVWVRGDAACLIWSRRPKAMCRKLFRIDRYSWKNPVTMWLCIGVVRFLSDKMWILNRIKLWKIRENPCRTVVCLSASRGNGLGPKTQNWLSSGSVVLNRWVLVDVGGVAWEG